MSDTTIHEAPDLSSFVTKNDGWRREQRAFAELLPSLLASHRDQYVAIHDGRVIASGSNVIDVALEAYRLVGYVPVFVDLVSDQPKVPVRIPSPRLLANRTRLGSRLHVDRGRPASSDEPVSQDDGTSGG